MPVDHGPRIRKYMEKAVDVMKQSIEEARHDGKKSPFVGAVLVKPDGTEETAYQIGRASCRERV